MSELKDLVPPLELCKKIPAGEFKDTYAAYFWDANGENITLDKRDGDAIWKDIVMAPAPTLQEIITAIGQYEIFGFGERFSIMQGDVCVLKQKSKTTAALKLWLKMKGIEA